MQIQTIYSITDLNHRIFDIGDDVIRYNKPSRQHVPQNILHFPSAKADRVRYVLVCTLYSVFNILAVKHTHIRINTDYTAL